MTDQQARNAFTPAFDWKSHRMDDPTDVVVAAEKCGWDRQQPEVDRLTQWVADLQSGMYINCVYCGHRYAPGTGPVMQEVLYDHIKTCPKHPLAAALAKLRQVIQAIENGERFEDKRGVVFRQEIGEAFIQYLKGEHDVQEEGQEQLGQAPAELP